MEFKIRSKKEVKSGGLTHRILTISMFILLVGFIVSQSRIQLFLIQLNGENVFLKYQIWETAVKLSLYSIHILLAFVSLLLLTQRLKYSLLMLVITISILLLKTVIIKTGSQNMEMPMQLPLYIDTILVFFIAGHFVVKYSDTDMK
jgi:hypothetical protein